MTVELRARHTPRGYVWQWRGRDATGAVRFDHNSLAETVIDPSLLPPSPSSSLQPAGANADALEWLVSAMRRALPVREAAEQVRAKWPALFNTPLDAERWVQATAQLVDRLERGVE
jgi:hypothetical protein